MATHSGEKLGKAGTTLGSKSSFPKQRSAAAKVLKQHQDKKH